RADGNVFDGRQARRSCAEEATNSGQARPTAARMVAPGISGSRFGKHVTALRAASRQRSWAVFFRFSFSFRFASASIQITCRINMQAAARDDVSLRGFVCAVFSPVRKD
ncbi:MAG TPA: hypothetical protein VFR86_26655, partial [Burkholderiaceae bacterium]|nr:hypothetical protein [Burkholderiaceae bacterium]